MRKYAITMIMMIFSIQSGYAEASQSADINLQEVQALNRLSEQMSGYITWMSNRDGDWEIYLMDIDGGSIHRLTDNGVPDMGARISPDGKLIAWHRGKEPRLDIWIMNADGSGKRMLVSGAVVGMWNSDRELVIHRGRNQNSSFLYNLNSGKERQIWPPKKAKLEAKDVALCFANPDFPTQNKDIRGAIPSPDGEFFVAWSSKPRGTWIFSSDGKFQSHVHSGCEGSFAPDGSFVYWVMTAGTFGRATLRGKVQKPLYKISETRYGHTYFPRLSRDMKYLIFGACPNDQHDHNTSDYEIFLMKMDNLKPVWNAPIRLTYDPGTDRWPDLFVGKSPSRRDPVATIIESVKSKTPIPKKRAQTGKDDMKVLVLTGNGSRPVRGGATAEFLALEKIGKVDKWRITYKATKDRNLPGLQDAQILWVGVDEMSKDGYRLSKKAEDRIKSFVRRGGVVIVTSQDSDPPRKLCGNGWIPEPIKGVEEAARRDFKPTRTAGEIFKKPNLIKPGTVRLDDTWAGWSKKYGILATTNAGKNIALAKLQYGKGMYLVTALHNETQSFAGDNAPLMENIMHYSVKWLRSRS